MWCFVLVEMIDAMCLQISPFPKTHLGKRLGCRHVVEGDRLCKS